MAQAPRPSCRDLRVFFRGLRTTANGLAYREREFHAAKRFDMPANRFREIEPGTAFRTQPGSQDFARLLLHGPAVAGRAQAQLRLNPVVEPPYRDAHHCSMISKQVEICRVSDKSDKMSDSQMKDYRITVRFPAALRQRLRAAALRRGTRESDLVRGAVERQLAAEDDALTAYERAKKAGLIGAVRGASRDLSTNPAHLDGFGSL